MTPFSASSLPLISNPVPDGVFLDFLYPAQALAWLRRASIVTIQNPRWEKRNARRLPDGFIVASRGYASKSRRKAAKADKAAHAAAALDIVEGTGASETKEQQRGAWRTYDQEDEMESELVRRREVQDTGERPSDSEEQINVDEGFADSAADVVETEGDPLTRLRNLLVYNRSGSKSAPTRQEFAEKAWAIYSTLDEESKQDVRLKIEMLVWFSLQGNDKADQHCAGLYESIVVQQRTLEIYRAGLSSFLKLGNHAAAIALHREALERLENGHQISRILFKYAVEHNLWKLASETEAVHSQAFGRAGTSAESKLFWIYVSEQPNLLEKAFNLAEALKTVGDGPEDLQISHFRAKFFQEAVTQECLQPVQISRAPQDSSDDQSRQSTPKYPPRAKMRYLFSQIAKFGDNPFRFLENVLLAMLREDSKFRHFDFHTVISFIYLEYSRISEDRKPSENVMMSLLKFLTDNTSDRKLDRSPNSMNIGGLVAHWRRFHGRVRKDAVKHLITFHALNGSDAPFSMWMKYLCTEYPSYEDRKDILWTSVYLQARRADLGTAQEAFAEVRRTMAEHGDSPDLKCWNVLLHAHSRADDMSGALINMQAVLDNPGLTPDEYTFHPILNMSSRRGDVVGTEELLRRFDESAGKRRSTALMGSLITAHVRNHDMDAAKEVLRETIRKVRIGEAVGSLTRCFNIVLGGYAKRRDLDSCLRAYQWMKSERVNLDVYTYASLIESLTVRRRTDEAYKILDVVMRKRGLKPTGYHYALIISSYTAARRYNDALRVYAEMSKYSIKPSYHAEVAYINALAGSESQSFRSSGAKEATGGTSSERARSVLRRVSRTRDRSELASKDPIKGLSTGGAEESDPTEYFETLIEIHGKRGAFDVVKSLFAEYQEARAATGLDPDGVSIRMLTALMGAHLRAKDYTEVEACWQMAKEVAGRVTPSLPLPPFKFSAQLDDSESLNAFDIPTPPAQTTAVDEEQQQDAETETGHTELSLQRWHGIEGSDAVQAPREPGTARRHVLSRPLRHYMRALFRQSRMVDLINTVTRVLVEGYTMDNKSWNCFIELLCSSSPPLALLAFTLTERFLIPSFPGWYTPGADRPLSNSERSQGFEHIRARYLRPGQLMPQYATLVRLGSALLQMRHLESVGGQGADANAFDPSLTRYVGTVKKIRISAPRTMFAVQSMPMIADDLQTRLLRREE